LQGVEKTQTFPKSSCPNALVIHTAAGCAVNVWQDLWSYEPLAIQSHRKFWGNAQQLAGVILRKKISTYGHFVGHWAMTQIWLILAALVNEDFLISARTI